MKKFLYCFMFAALALTACNKDDDDDNNNGGGGGGDKASWKIDGTSYKAVRSEAGTSGSKVTVTFTDAASTTDNHYVLLRLDKRPTAETQYYLEATKVGGITIFAATLEGGVPKAYFTNTNENGTANEGLLATVKNVNGKLTFTVPEIWLYDGTDLAADSIRFSGTLTEF